MKFTKNHAIITMIFNYYYTTMKEWIFSLIAAGLCALVTVKLAIWLDSEFNFSSVYFVDVVNYIHGLGFSAKKVLFFAVYLVYMITGIHKFFGNLILMTIGWVVLIGVAVVVVVGVLVFIRFLAGFV